MATNLVIDPELLERAVQMSGERTKRAAVTKALQEFIARRGQQPVADLFGKLEWDRSYDYKAERSRPKERQPTSRAPRGRSRRPSRTAPG